MKPQLYGQPQPGTERGQLQEELESLPDKVADALFEWRKAKADREMVMGVTYLRYRGDGEKRTVNEIDAMVSKDTDCYKAKLHEATCEANHVRLLEKLYAAKKLADMRTAY